MMIFFQSSKLQPIIVQNKTEDKTAKRVGQWTGQRRGEITGQVQNLGPGRGQEILEHKIERDSGQETRQGMTYNGTGQWTGHTEHRTEDKA